MVGSPLALLLFMQRVLDEAVLKESVDLNIRKLYAAACYMTFRWQCRSSPCAKKMQNFNPNRVLRESFLYCPKEKGWCKRSITHV